jgi:threonine dehydrogenase-like Zn-dependent dehydrogenase
MRSRRGASDSSCGVHDTADLRLDTVAEPMLEETTDALLRMTTSALCGTDLHMIRSTLSGMKNGTILSHERVGSVEELAPWCATWAPAMAH